MKIKEETQGLIFMQVFREVQNTVPQKLHFELACLLMHTDFSAELQKFINNNNLYFDNAAEMIDKLVNPLNYEYQRN